MSADANPYDETGVVLLTVVATRQTFAVPQTLIDDPPAWAFFLGVDDERQS